MGGLGVSRQGHRACLGMLLGTFVEIGFKRARVEGLARGPLGAEQGRHRPRPSGRPLRDPIPGALFANLHVTAVTPR